MGDKENSSHCEGGTHLPSMLTACNTPVWLTVTEEECKVIAENHTCCLLIVSNILKSL